MDEDNKEIVLHSKRSGCFKRIIKIICYFFLSIVGLNILLYILLSIPSIQQMVVDFAIGKIKPIINTEVSIDKVQIKLFNRINLQGVYIEDQNKDTLLYAQDLDVKLSIWGLFNNKLEINSINIDKAYINVSQKTPDSPYNFQFLIDAFASDSTQQDTNQSSMDIVFNDIKITNSRIGYNVLSEPETPSLFNASHISINDFNTELSLPSINTTKLDVQIRSLSLKEKSGFTIKNIEAAIKSKGFELWADKLEVTLPYSSIKVDTLSYNLFSKKFSINGDVSLSPQDLKTFMPDLGKLENNIDLKTNISGKLPEIKINNLTVAYGDEMMAQANASIADYEHYNESRLQFVISQFKITPKAITQFAQIGDSTFVMPEILSSIDYLRLTGDINGTLNKIKMNAEAWTNQGALQLSSDIAIKDTSFLNYDVDATLQTQNFNLVPFVGKEAGLQRISLYTDIKLRSIKGNLSANITGAVDRLQHDSVTLRNIRFKADYNPQKMSAWIDASLPVGKLSAQASMTQERNPSIKFDVDIHNLLIDKFYDNPAWNNPQLSLCLTGDLKGNTIDDIQGSVVLDSLIFRDANFNYQPGKLTLTSEINDGNRYIDVESSLLSARIDGKYQFLTIADELSNLMNSYLPGMFEKNRQTRKNNNNFNIDVAIYNTESLGKIFDLPANVIEPINIHGVINTIDNFIKIDSDIPYIKVGEIEIKDSKINISNTESEFIANAESRIVLESGDITLNMANTIESDTINSVLSFKNAENSHINIDGELRSAVHFQTTKSGLLHSFLQFEQTNINIDKLNLSFMPAKIENEGSRTSISNFGFMVGNGRMFSRYFGVEGVISDQKQDSLNVYFTNARIGDILKTFDINNISMTVDGDIKLANIMDKPEIYTDNLSISDIMVFNDTLGTLKVISKLDNNIHAIDFNAVLKNDVHKTNSQISGLVYTSEDKIDIKIDLDKLSMKWLQPFMADMLNKVEGSISSRISVKGSTSAPKAEGWLGFNDAYIGVDFTNVTYHISDTIKVFSDKVGFRDLIIEDNNLHKAKMSALLNFGDINNLSYIMNLDLDNFMILNTEARTDSLYYGKLIASGNVKIRGNRDDIKIDMKIQNSKNSSINISIPETLEAYEYQSIVYINTPVQDSSKMIPAVIEKPLPIDLNMDLTVTPDINLGVIINSTNPVSMKMKGNGLITFNYDMLLDNMKAYGDYTITEGTVKIRPQNIKTFEFKIQNGSKLKLIGDPMSSQFDLVAYYRVNASLATLDQSLSGQKIPVNCVLGIKGNINKMELTYDISLPDASDDVKQKVRSLLSTDDLRVRQFANLLLFNSFYSNTGNNNAGNNMIGSLLSSSLSSGLDALFGNVLGKNWQIGTNIDTSDGSFSDADVSVNVSTHLFDDKLTLNTNLGYRNNQNSASENTFVGDFDVEYQLSKVLKLKAYNHTNDKFYKQAATTQGIGVVYTKEAKTLKELLRFFGKKKKDKELKDKN